MSGMTQRGSVNRTVAKAALRRLLLEGLQVDDTYQRDVKRKHEKIVANFDEDALGVPLVGERSDGSLWIVDGLQRITALRKLGRTTVRADVFNSRGPEHEAEVYKKVNIDRTRLSSMEQYKALIVAGDREAWALKDAVEAEGFTIVVSKPGNVSEEARSTRLTCVGVLLQIAHRHGIEQIRFALRTVKRAWPGDNLGIYNIILSGLCFFYRNNEGVVDEDRLVDRLSTSTPQKILYTSQQMTTGRSDRTSTVAALIEKLYRKRANPRRGS